MVEAVHPLGQPVAVVVTVVVLTPVERLVVLVVVLLHMAYHWSAVLPVHLGAGIWLFTTPADWAQFEGELHSDVVDSVACALSVDSTPTAPTPARVTRRRAAPRLLNDGAAALF
jgi:hypothetical protein